MHSAYISSVIFFTIAGFVQSIPSNTSSVSTGNVTFTEVLLNSQYTNLKSLSRLEKLNSNYHNLFLSTLFTGVALKDVNHNKHFSNVIYDMLFIDWTTGDQKEYRWNHNPPDYHLPLKAVIVVAYGTDENKRYEVFWSDYGGDHAEDYLMKDRNYNKVTGIGINFTPCAQKCTPKFIRDSQDGGCPEIYAIWPYKISPKGINMDQVKAIYNLNYHCEIDTWFSFNSFVNAICALRKKNDPLCSHVKKAIKSKAFKQRNYYAQSLMDTIKSEETLKSKEKTLLNTMSKYMKESYPKN